MSKLQKYLKNNNQDRRFTNKTFSEFRDDMLKYSNEFFSENILDFSETSLGGLFLDFAAIVGDSLVYYAEQQFDEMNFETAKDPENISRLINRANIKNVGASPSSVEITFTFNIPALANGSINTSMLPIIRQNSTFNSNSGIGFVLDHDVDFTKSYKIKETIVNDVTGVIESYVVHKKGSCTSGKIEKEFFTFSQDSGKFLSYALENQNITKIISVIDNEYNEYFEVDYLTQDFVYRKVENSHLEENYLSIKPAPYRFILQNNIDTGTSTLTFGSGDNTSLNDNIVPDNEDLLVSIKNTDYLSNFNINPESILNSNLLGISPSGKTLTVTYKYGGGKNHNVGKNSIRSVNKALIEYPNLIDESGENVVSNTLTINNEEDAVGGTNIPSIEEIKGQYLNAIKMQSRIVTQQDLLTSLSIMPNDFGKVYKCTSLENKYIPGLRDLYVICKDDNDYLTSSTDVLKTNISKFINQHRLIGDNFNIADCPIYNFGISMKIKIKKGYEHNTVVFQLTNDIISYMRFDSLDIGEAIDVNKLCKIVESNPGVSSIITPKNKVIISKNSSNDSYNLDQNTAYNYNVNRFNPIIDISEGLIYPQRGGIFELKYPASDIKIMTVN